MGINNTTLTAFVSKDSDMTNTYKNKDNVYFKKMDSEGNGTLHWDGWSIYVNNEGFMDVLDESLSSKKLTMSLNTRGQNNSDSLTAFIPNSDEQNTLYDGDTVNFKGVRGEGVGVLRFNGWSIREINSTNTIMDIDKKSLSSKELTMTPDNSSHPLPVFKSQLTGYSTYGSYYGGKRSRRRKSKKSRRSRKYR